MTVVITPNEYWSEIEGSAKVVLNSAKNSKEQHGFIQALSQDHKWVTVSECHYDILKNTKNLGEVDEAGFDYENIHQFLKEAAYWAFYGDITDKIKELQTEGVAA